jgi:sugar lactone lactonase YvrE
LIVVVMTKKQIVETEEDRTSVHANLSTEPAGYLNDMAVDRSGRAYVDFWGPRTPNHDRLGDYSIRVTQPDGKYDVAASGEICRPMGLAISADGTTLIAAETFGHRLSAFTIEPDGVLSNRRVVTDTGKDVSGRHLRGRGRRCLGWLANDQSVCSRSAMAAR